MDHIQRCHGQVRCCMIVDPSHPKHGFINPFAPGAIDPDQHRLPVPFLLKNETGLCSQKSLQRKIYSWLLASNYTVFPKIFRPNSGTGWFKDTG